MSGHSKWSTIKRKKGAADAQRSKLWSKLLRFVEVAAREGGGSIEANPTLATAVQKARDSSVPNNKNRAAQEVRGAFNGAGGKLAEPGSVAFMFESKGIVIVSAATASEDDVFLTAAEAG